MMRRCGEPTRTWAAVEAVLMPLLDGTFRRGPRGGRRGRQASFLRHRAGFHDPNELLLPVLQEFPQLAPFPSTDDTLRGSSPARLMRWMLAGLKNWEQGRLAAAAPFFQAVAAAKTAPQDEWVKIYQPLATNYLADFKTLSAPVFAAAPADRDACERATHQLAAMLPVLKTRGRARFNVTAWKQDLAKLARSCPNPPPRSRRSRPAKPELRTVLATLADHSAKCDFAAASEYLSKLPTTLTEPPAKPCSLTDSAAVLLSDLGMDLKRNAAGLAVSGHLKSGETFTKIAATDRSDGIQVSLNGQSRDCTWADLDPGHRSTSTAPSSRRKPTSSENLRRHETAIAFQWLAGDRAQAVANAERIAADNEGFANRWKALKAGLPAP